MPEQSAQVEQLRSTLAKMELGLSAIESSILWVDDAGVVQWCNRPFCVLVERPYLRILGAGLGELLPLSSERRLLTADEHPVQIAVTQQSHGRGMYQMGDRSLDLSWSRVEVDTNERSFVFVIGDVTERVHRERRLEALVEAAAAASRAKSEFVANMSHEIRTPMNAILGMTALTLDTGLTERQRDYLLTVQSSAESLLALINEVLDFSKVEAGKLDLTPVEFGLRDCIERVLRSLRLRRDTEVLKLTADLSRDVPDVLLGDPGRLSQVLLNLVGNAIRFTNDGGVAIGVAVADRSDDDIVLQFSVRDTGIGVPPEKLDVIFEPFSQADSSSTRAYGGTGLGLTISKRLVELMGGAIWLESTVGEGSTFHFTARMKQPTGGVQDPPAFRGAAPEKARYPPGRCQRILVAEDNVVNQRVVRHMLERIGHDVTIACDGLEALACLKSQAFDVVLMDIQMPEMDGVEATAVIRAMEKPTGQHLPIVAVTAHAMEGDRERFLHAGMDAYLSKPFSAAALSNAIELAIRSAVEA